MKPPTRFGFILMAILVLVIFTLPAFAQMAPGTSPHSGQRPPSSSTYSEEPFSLESYKDRLGLTDEQAEKFAKIRSDYLKESIKKEADIKVAGVELTELLEQKKVDLGQVEKKLRQMESLKSDLAMHRIKMLFKTKDFLSDEQFEKLKSQSIRMMQHGMMQGRMGSGMGKVRPGAGMSPGMGDPGMSGHPDVDSPENKEK